MAATYSIGVHTVPFGRTRDDDWQLNMIYMRIHGIQDIYPYVLYYVWGGVGYTFITQQDLIIRRARKEYHFHVRRFVHVSRWSRIRQTRRATESRQEEKLCRRSRSMLFPGRYLFPPRVHRLDHRRPERRYNLLITVVCVYDWCIFCECLGMCSRPRLDTRGNEYSCRRRHTRVQRDFRRNDNNT